MDIHDEKDLEKFSFNLLENYKKTNPFKRTYSTIFSLTKWIFIVFSGTLIWNLDYFSNSTIYFIKPLVILIISYFAIATILILLSIVFLFKREFNYGYAYDRTEHFDHFIKTVIEKESDIDKAKTKINDYSDSILSLLNKGDKLVLATLSLIYISAIFFTVALLTLLYYYFYFQT
ncbi:MAG: hypothetical protein P9M11_10240 [Candidatus Tenebribacter burtonii]|jgi:hypothetical protein|nr:hypothetical protein [Candidatus Tenebribacter burtonii]